MGLVSRSFVLGPFATNAYLVTCEETRETAVIDVGFEPERVLEAIAAEALPVRSLLNTHAHYDHVASMGVMQQRLGVPVWLHPEDRFLLDAVAQQGAAFGLPAAEPPRDVRDLADGQVIELGRERVGSPGTELEFAL